MMNGPPPPVSKRVFDKYDNAAKDGRITINEFKEMVHDLGYFLSDDECRVAMTVLDTDGNGSIQYDEFAAWWKSDDRFEKLHLRDDELEVMQQAIRYFDHFDSDRSGTISADEFKSLHADLQRNRLTTKSLESCLEDLDSDRNGVISFNEYINWLRRIGALKVAPQ